MKFTAFALATAAASASAQTIAFNPFAQGMNTQQQFGGVAYAPYQVQQPVYPVQQPIQQYAIQQPVFQDPLAWERDCTWINSISFRAALSMATCGQVNCQGTSPNGNGGGSDRKAALFNTGGKTGGAQYHVWGSVINRAGRVCAVAYTGNDLTQQFPYGRIQSMKRANTANSLSLPSRAMPSHVADNHRFIEHSSQSDGVTAAASRRFFADNGWYGFSHDRFNPGNIDVQHQGATSNYGEACGTQRQDPMCMQKPGGFDYSAGGLALYDRFGQIKGAIGVAGDNDCTSHAIAWKTREQLQLNFTPPNTDRATFNSHAQCTALGARPADTLERATAAEVCGTGQDDDIALLTTTVSTNADNASRGTVPTDQTAKVQFATWAHTGAKAEDNVFFSNNEVRNFPACYEMIRRFSIDNPTKAATGQTK